MIAVPLKTCLVLLVLTMLMAGCKTGALQTAEHLRTNRIEKYQAPVDTATLQPGDKVQIFLYTPQLQPVVEAVIDDRDSVTLPLIGPVKLGGLAPAKAEEAIRQAYILREIYKTETIQVLVKPPLRDFYVEGRVNRPGPYQFTRSITINMAISMAGGRDEFAAKDEAWLTRSGKKSRVNTAKDGNRIRIEPGDIVKIERGIW